MANRTLLIEPGPDGIRFAVTPRCPAHHTELTSIGSDDWHCTHPDGCDTWTPGRLITWHYAPYETLPPPGTQLGTWLLSHLPGNQ